MGDKFFNTRIIGGRLGVGLGGGQMIKCPTPSSLLNQLNTILKILGIKKSILKKEILKWPIKHFFKSVNLSHKIVKKILALE